MAQAPPTFRIFVSSTFRDLKAERDALQEHVFPRLRELCVQRGARFQAIDLRWGLSEQAALDQQTIPICLGEIDRCRGITPRPNFVVLLGDRYGWRPLPAEIAASEFEQIGKWVAGRPESRLLGTWYRRDDNAVPAVYCLQPRTGALEDNAAWAAQVEEPLRELLLSASHRMALPADENVKYEASATEQEILEGALRVEDASEHVLCFFREVEELPHDERAADYRDVDAEQRPDTSARERLQGLKAKLREHLAGNVHEYKARWQADGITTGHLEALCADVYRSLSKVILTELERLEATEPLAEEIAVHESFGRELRRSFLGRSEVLQRIRAYLSESGRRPLAVTGEPGSGKTALLAQAVHEARDERENDEVVVRFVGASPASRNVRSLLEDLCHQISRCYAADESTIPGDFRGLVEELPQRLALASADKPLIVVLDAVDQLSSDYRAGNLVWLPTTLPEHVRVVVSSLPGQQLANLKAVLPASNLVELSPLSGAEVEELLDRWLAAAGRRLQPSQRAHVLARCAASGLPLYVKLVFEEARRWKSYTAAAPVPERIPALIEALFDRLGSAATHGEILVGRALGLLAAARHGLTEDELLDLLSADQEVMADFLRRSPRSPAVARLPVVVWSRLYSDLEAYLTRQRADGTTTLAFYHPTTFGRAVREKYLGGTERQARHRELAGFFASRPHEPRGPEGESRPALRTLAELPYQQSHAELWQALGDTLAGFGFLHAKVSAFGPRSVVEDLDEALRCGLEEEWPTSLRDAVNLSAGVTAEDPDQLAGQLTGRLSPQDSHTVHKLLDQTSRWHAAPWLRPLLPTLMAAGGPLLHSLQGHSDLVGAVAVTADGRRAVSGSDDSTLRIWDLERAEELTCLTGHAGAVRDLVISPDGRHAVSASDDETVRVWDLESRTLCRTMAGHGAAVICVCVSADGHVVSGAADGTINVWHLETGELVRTLRAHEDWVRAVDVALDGGTAISASDDETVKVWNLRTGALKDTLEGHRGRVNCVALSPDASLAVSGGTDRNLVIWGLQHGGRKVLAGHGSWIRCVAVTADGQRVVSGSDDRSVRIWDLDSGRHLRTLSGHTAEVWDIALTRDGRRLVSASGDRTLKVWDPDRDEKERPVLRHPDWGVSGIAVTPDGQRVISASTDSTLGVWDLTTGQEQLRLRGHTAPVRAVALTPGGGHALSASDDRTVRVWDLSSGRQIHTLSAHTRSVSDVAVAADGRRAVSASDDQSLSVWDLERGEEIRPLAGHTDSVTSVAISPDGARVLSASWDGRLILWDLDRGRRLQRISGEPRGVWALTWTKDGTSAVVAGEQGLLHIIDLETGKQTRVLRGHSGIVWDVAGSPDGRLLASVSEDRTARLWDLASGTVVAGFTGESGLRACAFAGDGLTLAIGETQSQIHVLRLEGWDGGGE